MSTFLLLLLAFLLGGTIVSFLLARFRPRYAADGAAISAILSLVLWLFAERSVPFDASIGNNNHLAGLSLRELYVDDFVWRTSFSLLLLVIASLLVMISINRSAIVDTRRSMRSRLAPGLTLLMTATALFSLWSTSLPALLTGWTLLAGSWAILLWSSWKDKDDPSGAIVRMGLLLLSLLFLGFALASQPNITNLASQVGSWSAQTRAWATMAAIVQLGAFPFHWWRPSKDGLAVGLDALIYIVPAIAGAQLLARLAADNGGEGSVTLVILTAFGLLGLLYGVGYSWSHLDNPKSIGASLVLALAGLILLAAAWAGEASTYAFIQVLILAVGGILLAVTWPGSLLPAYKIPIFVGVASIAGFPLTAGFLGITGLYGNLADSNRLILAVVTALTLTPIIAAVFFHFWTAGGDPRGIRMSTLGLTRFVLALSLLALGLIMTPAIPDEINQVVGWILLLLSTLGAASIAWYAIRAPEAQQAIKGAFHVRLPLDTGKQLLGSFLTASGTVVRDAAAILEGEGGMLWVLLLVVIFWLARLV
jgi:hypothetical protein